jgi:hypothetical protein
VIELFFFQKEKQKAWFRFAEIMTHQNLTENEVQSIVLLRNQKTSYPNLGEADPGGLGACPQNN